MKKYLHFYFNKYILRLSGKKKYFISYSFKHKAIWYRVAKVGTRSIKNHLEDDGGGQVLYASEAPYIPSLYKDYFKFAFVREPMDRFISGWKDKVLERNYYKFDNITHEKMKDLNHFIDWVADQDINSCDEHIRSQSALIDLENVDFVGRFENFHADLKFVLEKLNIHDDEIHHNNRTKQVKLELTSEQEQKIKEIYKQDYLNFYSN